MWTLDKTLAVETHGVPPIWQTLNPLSQSHVSDAEAAAVGTWRGLDCTLAKLPSAPIWLLTSPPPSGGFKRLHQPPLNRLSSSVIQLWCTMTSGSNRPLATWELQAMRQQMYLPTMEPAAPLLLMALDLSLPSAGFSLSIRNSGMTHARPGGKKPPPQSPGGINNDLTTEPMRSNLSHPVLHRLLALSSSHRDLDWYHCKFHHKNSKLTCSCSRKRSSE